MTKKPDTDSRVAALIVRAMAKHRRTQKLAEARQAARVPIQRFKQFVAARRAASSRKAPAAG